MNCKFCNKQIKYKLNFKNIFQKNDYTLCKNCKNDFCIKIDKIENQFNLYYFSKYENIKEDIYQLKYFGNINIIKKYKILFDNFFKEYKFDKITITPTNIIRESVRGYNHIKIIADFCEIDYLELFTSSYRQKQSKLHEKRVLHKVNIKSEKVKLIKDIKNILIIDDIFTSGMTMLSLAKELKKHNSNIEISFLTISKS